MDQYLEEVYLAGIDIVRMALSIVALPDSPGERLLCTSDVVAQRSY